VDYSEASYTTTDMHENGVTEMVRRLNFTVVWRIL
jgi:hypothetical protein